MIQLNSVTNTLSFILTNYNDLITLSYQTFNTKGTEYLNSIVNINVTYDLWFPWESFFSFITILSTLYILTFLSIYNTDNSYYAILYLVFLVLLFSSNLVLLDLDIFAGFLVLIESVVILMLFFLVIYLSPNINFRAKIQFWKTWMLLSIIVILISTFSYLNLGDQYTVIFNTHNFVFDDFYEALNDVFISELTGIYASLYWTNSLLLLIIGVLLLIASIICVVLVSFFTRFRNYNMMTFLEFFNLAKHCYSIIFLRKQNLVKQGRGNTSTRLFKKKTVDTNLHTEYREKQNLYETEQKKTI